MRRLAAVMVVLLLALTAGAWAARMSRSRHRRGVGGHHVLDGFTERELGVMKERRRRLREGAPGHPRQGGRRDQRRQDRRGDPRRQRARRRPFLHRRHTGGFCANGAWMDLGPTHEADGVDATDDLPGRPPKLLGFDGKRCAMPMLADVYGLYYNKELFAKAGIAQPPRTLSELTADAKSSPCATRTDRSRSSASTRPRLLREHRRPLGAALDANWTTTAASRSSPTTRLGKAPALAEGAHRLVRLRQPRPLPRQRRRRVLAQQRLRGGKLAMSLDGEWRVAFIRPSTRSSSTARRRCPVDDAQPELYGSGYTTAASSASRRRQAPGRGVGAAQVPGHRHRRAREAVQRDPQRADDVRGAEVTGPRADPEFNIFLDIFANPNTSDDADHAGGECEPGSCRRVPDEVPGRQGRRPRGRARRPRQADRRPARGCRRLAGAMR